MDHHDLSFPSLRPWRGWLPVAASLSALLLTPLVVLPGTGPMVAPVQAATRAKVTIAETELGVGGPGGTAEARAVCPANTRVVGGGVVQRGTPDALFVSASGPLAASGDPAQTNDGDIATQWYAAVMDFTNSGRVYRVFALCSATSRATIEETEFTIPSGQSSTAAAVCPGDTRALGGGALQIGPPAIQLLVRASGPLAASGTAERTNSGDAATQWTATMVNATNATRTFRVFALCAADAKATIKAAQFTVPGSANRTAFATCGRKKRAVGGGVVPTGTADHLFVDASGPLDASGRVQRTNDGDTATQWIAAMRNDSGTEQTVRVFAICR